MIPSLLRSSVVGSEIDAWVSTMLRVERRDSCVPATLEHLERMPEIRKRDIKVQRRNARAEGIDDFHEKANELKVQ